MRRRPQAQVWALPVWECTKIKNTAKKEPPEIFISGGSLCIENRLFCGVNRQIFKI